VTSRAEPPFVLSLDVGTSSTRALLFDARGRRVPGIQAKATHTPTTTAGGGAFFDPDELLRRAGDCLDEARRGAGDAPIAALAMASFWHSLMGVDSAGRPATPVLTWADTRPTAAAAALRDRLDEAQVHQRTGCRLHASYWPAKLAWLRKTEPEAFRRTKRWMSFAEYLQWRLGGELACSVCMASGTGLLTQRTCNWDAETLQAVAVEPDQLSPLVDMDHRLPGGWLPALGDGAASNVGSGALDARWLALNIGTSSALRVVREGGVEDELPRSLWRYRLDRRRAVVGGALSEGGNLWAWLRVTLRLPTGRALEAELARMEPDSHGLTVLPFIAGERSPGWAAEAALTVHGARPQTRPIEIGRACLEAVAYRLLAVYDDLAPFAPEAQIVASGSAILSSPAWLQIVADVLNRPVRTLRDPEATSRGAALIALDALGVQQVERGRFDCGRTYEPNPESNARHREAAARQQALYTALYGRSQC